MHDEKSEIRLKTIQITIIGKYIVIDYICIQRQQLLKTCLGELVLVYRGKDYIVYPSKSTAELHRVHAKL